MASLQAHPDFRCCVIGLERCDCGSLYFQGYLELSCSIRTNVRNKLLPPARHCEARRGSAKAADLYCQNCLQSRGEWRRAYWLGPTFGVEAGFTQAGVRSLREGHRSDPLGVLENYRSLSVVASQLVEALCWHVVRMFGSRGRKGRVACVVCVLRQHHHVARVASVRARDRFSVCALIRDRSPAWFCARVVS